MAPSDVCLVLEGTYPYVRGGVSTWVHELITNLPDLRFDVVHVSPDRRSHTRRAYALPENVISFSDQYCREPLVRGDRATLRRVAHAERRRHARTRGASRVLNGIRRLHLGDVVDGSLLDDLGARDLAVGAFLHGRAAFELTTELYERLAPDASFVDFFWHFRSMHLPLVSLLSTEAPAAALYHSPCTGYAGLLAATWSRRTGRPLIVTEHGIYTRERDMELDRAARTRHDGDDAAGAEPWLDRTTSLALRRMWSKFFRVLAGCAYGEATTIVSLCEDSRQMQIVAGAPADRTRVVPNGIDVEQLQSRLQAASHSGSGRGRFRVGFVGRVVPIKDVITLIRAFAMAVQVVDAELRIIGPSDEDPAYVRRCRRLVEKLGLEHAIRFVDVLPIDQIYGEIDMLVLTSFSEGQPLVILEAAAAGIPVVASNVGACRELLEGREAEDRALGPSGIVTRLAAPHETAAAIVRLAEHPELRQWMGSAGRQRVATYYQKSAVFSTYRDLYASAIAGASWPASAGASSA